MKKISLLLMSFILSACQQAAVTAVNIPAILSFLKSELDVDFGSKYGSRLDIYQPNEVKAAYPVIVFFHGGGWTDGSRKDYKFVAQAFTSRGYIVVIPDYVKYPAQKFPIWQEDSAKALAWVHKNIARYKGDPWQTYVVGHSAGAHIGALLAADGKYLYEEQGHPKWIRAFAGLAGPYNFTPTEQKYMDIFGPPKNYPYMQVNTYITGAEPPMLLLWGKDDDTVAAVNHEKLAEAIKQNGGVVEVKEYENTDHIDIISTLSPISPASAPVADDITYFFDQYR